MADLPKIIPVYIEVLKMFIDTNNLFTPNVKDDRSVTATKIFKLFYIKIVQ